MVSEDENLKKKQNLFLSVVKENGNVTAVYRLS
jgi:hypothetical protein